MVKDKVSPTNSSKTLIINIQPSTEIEEHLNDTIKLEELRCMKFSFLIMKIFGSYFDKKQHWLYKFYCCLVLIGLFLDFFKTINVFNFFIGESEVFNAFLVLKIIGLMWLLLCSFNNVILVINQAKNDRQQLYFKNCNILFKYSKNSKAQVKYLSLFIYIVYIIALTIIIGQYVFQIYCTFFTTEFASYIVLAPFHRTDWAKNSIPYKIFVTLLQAYTASAWVLPVAYYAMQCAISYSLLDEFNHQFKYFVDNNAIVPNNNRYSMSTEVREDGKNYANEKSFDHFIDWHLKLCNTVRVLNQCYKEFIGLTLLLNIPMIFLLLYIMADWNGNCVTGLNQFMYPFWLFSLSIILLIVLSLAISLNIKVLKRSICIYFFILKVKSFLL